MSYHGVMRTPLALACLALFSLTACGQRSGTPSTVEPKTNANATVTESSTQRPQGQADTENVATQSNSGRPDSPKDLAPGTDGNTNPPPR